MAWIMPMGMTYTKATMVQEWENQRRAVNVPMTKATTKAHTGIWVFQTSILTTPKTNIVASFEVRKYLYAHFTDKLTEDDSIPPLGDCKIKKFQRWARCENQRDYLGDIGTSNGREYLVVREETCEIGSRFACGRKEWRAWRSLWLMQMRVYWNASSVRLRTTFGSIILPIGNSECCSAKSVIRSISWVTNL